METEPIMTTPRRAFGQTTHAGMGKFSNQDAVYSLLVSTQNLEAHPDFGLFIAADGMGRTGEGEKAASLAIEMLEQEILNTIYLAMLRKDADRLSVTESLVAAVQKANAAIIAQGSESGGCTVTAAVIVGDLAYIAHVGDTRAYLLSRDSIEQLTRDHTIVQLWLELGQLTPEQARNHPQRNVLYQALGHTETVVVGTFTLRLSPASWLLLCTDGLTIGVEDNEIAELVKQSQSPQQACDRLVTLANMRGGFDNISVIVVANP